MQRHTYQNPFEEKVVNNTSLCFNSKYFSFILTHSLTSNLAFSPLPSPMLQNQQEKL